MPGQRVDGDAEAPTAALSRSGRDDDTGPVARPDQPGSARRPRAPRPASLPPARAMLGAAVAVAGVLLGIGTLLWATDAPGGDPALQAPAALVEAGGDEPAVALPGDPGRPAEIETAPVDPPPPLPEPAPADQPVAEAPAPEPAAQPAATEPVPVLVLNNSRVEGLAARAAAGFEQAGWPVRDTGSLRGRIRASTVYYPAGQQDVAREFARRFPGIERVLPRLAGLPGSGLTVVVTRDFQP